VGGAMGGAMGGFQLGGGRGKTLQLFAHTMQHTVPGLEMLLLATSDSCAAPPVALRRRRHFHRLSSCWLANFLH